MGGGGGEGERFRIKQESRKKVGAKGPSPPFPRALSSLEYHLPSTSDHSESHEY